MVGVVEVNAEMSENDIILRIQNVANQMRKKIVKLEDKTRNCAVEMYNDNESELYRYNMLKAYKLYDTKYWTAKSMYSIFYEEFKEYLEDEENE